MNILCITHADFESPGVIHTWADANHFNFTIVSPYKNESLPPTNTFDSLVIMGGPQDAGAGNRDEYPYLKGEIELIQNSLAENKAIIGFCLGAQLIGEALGAKTERSTHKEVGVYPITLTEDGLKDPLLKDLGESFDVIHWHNDMPGLTPDATLLAYNEGCPRQIIRYKSNVYGFQCHLEMTKENIQGMIDAVPQDLKPSQFTQTKEQLLSNDYPAINKRMFHILDKLMGIKAI